MIPHRKISWIADPLHGTISISRLEKLLISTPEYNRLHNVLQNSTVYLTYPANRTSRFIHSIGCAHVAGKMFRNAIVNADEKCLRHFMKEFEKRVKEIGKTNEFRDGLARLKIKTPGSRLLHPEVTKMLSDPFYEHETPSRLSSAPNKCAFVLLLQAIRFVGLLHDVGHPPFSHVSEDALGILYEHLEDLDREKRINRGEKALLEKFRRLREAEEGSAFHEALGIHLSARLLDDVLSNSLEGDDDRTTVTLHFLKVLTLNILKDANAFSESLHSLVSGDIDADRIDYVLRDSMMSGYETGSLQIERLVKSFTLVCNLEPEGTKSPDKLREKERNGDIHFLPSVRAIGVLEAIFKRRANLYKQVIYHHRVVKFDALLRDCIIELAKQSLKKSAKKETVERNGDFLLPRGISGLWHVLEPEMDFFSADRTNCYIQWDDAWLLSTLRRQFMQLQVEGADAYSDAFFAKLQELLSNRKMFYSLFKRADEFREVERAFIRSIPGNFDWNSFVSQLPETVHPAVDDFRRLVQPKPAEGNLTPSPTAHEGLALMSLFRLLTRAGTWGKHGGLDMVKKALAELKATFAFVDALVIRKAARVGIKASQLLVSSTGLVRIGDVSTLVRELEEATRYAPAFFVFVHPGRNLVTEKSLAQWRDMFGRILCETFCKEVNARTNNPQLSFSDLWK